MTWASILKLNHLRLFQRWHTSRRTGRVTHFRSNIGFDVDCQHRVWCWILPSKIWLKSGSPKCRHQFQPPTPSSRSCFNQFNPSISPFLQCWGFKSGATKFSSHQNFFHPNLFSQKCHTMKNNNNLKKEKRDLERVCHQGKSSRSIMKLNIFSFFLFFFLFLHLMRCAKVQETFSRLKKKMYMVLKTSGNACFFNKWFSFLTHMVFLPGNFF